MNQIAQPPDTSYAASCPWIRVVDPRTSDTLLVHPAGYLAGIYARTDIERGVHTRRRRTRRFEAS